MFGYRLYISGGSVYSEQMEKKFYMIEQSFLNTGKTIDDRNWQLIGFLRRMEDNMPMKAKPMADAGKEIDSATKYIVKYIEQLKNNFKSEHNNPRINDLNKTRLKIERYYNFIDEKCMPFNIKPSEIYALVNLKKYNSNECIIDLFNNLPYKGVSLLLTKIQMDIKITESECVAEISKMILYCGPTFDVECARVVPKAVWVPIGDKFEADIFLTKYSRRSDCNSYEIYVNGKQLKTDGTFARFEQNVTEGEHKYKGEIRVQDPITYETKSYEFEGEYIGYKLPPNIKK